MKKVFIDGKAGTTGLRIEERLSMRDDIEIVTLPDELRKDPTAKREILNFTIGDYITSLSDYTKKTNNKLCTAFLISYPPHQISYLMHDYKNYLLFTILLIFSISTSNSLDIASLNSIKADFNSSEGFDFLDFAGS